MTKFSTAFDVSYATEQGNMQTALMGCYGIGVSRLMGVIAEYASDDRGLVWNQTLTPYHYNIILMDNQHIDIARTIANVLESKGKRVIIDDRVGVRLGEKFADSDLRGIATKIICTPKTIGLGVVELKQRTQDTLQEVRTEEVATYPW
jgi:prolyl-tRNA synthetase